MKIYCSISCWAIAFKYSGYNFKAGKQGHNEPIFMQMSIFFLSVEIENCPLEITSVSILFYVHFVAYLFTFQTCLS
jgi:hypothetical protein